MKKIGKFLLSIIIGAWFIVAVFVTICLLSYNSFKVTTFGSKSLVIVDSDEMEPNYYSGDLLIVTRNSDKNIDIGDEVLYYDASMTKSVLINTGIVDNKKAVTARETTYTINDEKISGEYVLGKTSTIKVYHTLGLILRIFTSKWGFMFLIIFPTLFAVIYEIMLLIDSAHNPEI